MPTRCLLIVIVAMLLAPVVAEAANESQPANAVSKRIHVVEDSNEVRTVIVNQLERHGFSVAVDENGDAALARILAGEEFDLMLTDIVMPGSVQGPELVERAIEVTPGLKVILMSGYPKDALKQGQQDLANAPLLLKPFSSADLLAAIQKSLEA